MQTKAVYLGAFQVGGGAPVSVQSMTNTPTEDLEATLKQIKILRKGGAEIIRLAVPNEKAGETLKEIVEENKNFPLVADIHFDWRLAVLSLKSGVLGLRINPGNIGCQENIKKVAEAALKYGAAIRVGVNAGSLDKEILAKYKKPNAQAMLASALKEVTLLEGYGFTNIKVSLKSSNVLETIKAAKLWAENSSYPQHLGLTEAGDLKAGVVKSSLVLGSLLMAGVGDTIRVSLTANPLEEVKIAWEILRAVGLRARGVEIISCPTCGRCQINLISLAQKVKKQFQNIEKPLKIAVMGCVVNGPGEAKEADFGIAGTKEGGIIFAKGKIIERVPYAELAKRLNILVKNYLKNLK